MGNLNQYQDGLLANIVEAIMSASDISNYPILSESDALFQNAHYDGWKSFRGLKLQAISDEFGFYLNAERSTSLQSNDLLLSRSSLIFERPVRTPFIENEGHYVLDITYSSQFYITSHTTTTDLFLMIFFCVFITMVISQTDEYP